jgi:hypothetical protein
MILELFEMVSLTLSSLDQTLELVLIFNWRKSLLHHLQPERRIYHSGYRVVGVLQAPVAFLLVVMNYSVIMSRHKLTLFQFQPPYGCSDFNCVKKLRVTREVEIALKLTPVHPIE